MENRSLVAGGRVGAGTTVGGNRRSVCVMGLSASRWRLVGVMLAGVCLRDTQQRVQVKTGKTWVSLCGSSLCCNIRSVFGECAVVLQGVTLTLTLHHGCSVQLS